jgi:predicted O-methyltransferase YrrM
VPLAWHSDPAWSFAQCDSVSSQAQAFLPPSIDLLFIDTSHTYEQTLKELACYGPRMRRGGLIACHDTQWDEGDVSLPAPGGPVAEALDTYCERTGHAWRNRQSGPGFYGLGIIWT